MIKNKLGKKGINLGEKNGLWKGDKVSKRSPLHNWIRRHKPKLDYCEHCFKKNKRLDLANISQKYKRNINDFEWLCRSCHMKKDGRINNLLKGGGLAWSKTEYNLGGENHPMYGIHHTEEAKKKMRKPHRKRIMVKSLRLRKLRNCSFNVGMAE